MNQKIRQEMLNKVVPMLNDARWLIYRGRYEEARDTINKAKELYDSLVAEMLCEEI